MYKTINIDDWHRKDLFYFFQKFDNPTWDIIAEVNIQKFYEATKELNASFFLSFLYIATRVCNRIDAFRQRIDPSGNVVEFEWIHPGSTILYDNSTFGFGYFQFVDDYHSFLIGATKAFEDQKAKKDLDPKDEDLARIYFSPIPWISFSGFRHPFDRAANQTIPKIVFGRHHEINNSRVMPVGLTLHHGFADGYHAGLFFDQLQKELDDSLNFMHPIRTT